MKRSIRISGRVAACLIPVLFCLMACAVMQDRSKKDLETMQGTWVAQKWVNAGMSAPADKVGQLALVFKGDQVLVSAGDPATIKLDDTKRPPHADFIDKNKHVDHGIYMLAGDTLTFCMALAESGKDRPTVFESTSSNGFMLVVLKRQIGK